MRARDNPFAVSRVLAVRYRFSGKTWDELLARLWRCHGRAAVVGPHGSGKTTLLEDLEPRLHGLGFQVHWLRLSEDRPKLPAWVGRGGGRDWSEKDFVLLDGAEQLSRLAWERFRWRCRRAGGLLITTHRAGRLPTLHTCVTDQSVLGHILQRLLGPADAGCVPPLDELLARHRGNVRDVLRDLYDRWAAESNPLPRRDDQGNGAHRCIS